jgi:hypothetical protein
MRFALSMLVLWQAVLPVRKPSQMKRLFAPCRERFLPHGRSTMVHKLAGIMAEDVDFVTVRRVWLQGRANFQKYHTRVLSGRFHDATNIPLEIQVRFLHPD